MRHTFRALLFGALASFALVGSSMAAETVKIAYINGVSGVFAVQGEEQLKVFRAAIDMVNAKGGVLGKSLEIVIFDSKNNPQEALLMLKQATDQNIHFVATTVTSVVHALNDAVKKHNSRNPEQAVLLLNFNGLDPALTEEKCSFWSFRFETHADMQIKALALAIAKQPSIHKIYLINQDYAFGQSVSRGAREMLKVVRPDVQIVGDDLIPLGKVKDFAPYVSKIRASEADAIFTGNWGNDLSLLIKASNESGLTASYYTLLGAFFGTPTAIGAAGANRIKSVYAWHVNAADPAWEKRLIETRAKYHALSDMAYLPAYRTVEMLSDAITKAGTTDPLKVAYALEGLKYAGPSGESWMRAEDHQLIAPIYLLNFAKAGQPGVKHDAEDTGYGWKTELLVSAKDNVPQVKCDMERPAR